METIETILAFWFGAGYDQLGDPTVAGRQSKLWWGKNPEADEEIRARFGSLVISAGRGERDEWKATPSGWLALILLTDQFPRNMYRNTADMYRFDGYARELSANGIEAGIDQQLRLIERVFFYLPLEHAESAEDQRWCVDLMRGLAREAPEAERDVFEDFVNYAEAHARIIDRFGRFPHRNKILGRTSSKEEIAFLRQPGSSF